MTVACLSIFNACEKSDDFIDPTVDQETTNNPLFEGLDTIAFSVENNIMVFETEEDYQKCLDFLGTIEVKDYQLFEKEVGFSSLLALSNSVMQTCPIEDEKFATLLNPQMQIIIEHYLFTLNHDEEKIEALFIGKNYDLKSIDINSMKEFSYDDDVFAILKGENLKSVATDYCGQENSIDNVQEGIQTRLDYNKYGIYNSLVIQISNPVFQLPYYFKYRTVDSPLDNVPSGITSRCFYYRSGKMNEIIYSKPDPFSSSFIYETGTNKKTVWDNRRRLIGFRLDIEFHFYINPGQTIYVGTNMIECHQY